MTWVLKAASACGVWALTIPFAVVLLIWVAVEEAWKRVKRWRRERRVLRQARRVVRQAARERASW